MMIAAMLLGLAAIVLIVDCVAWAVRVLIPEAQRGLRPVPGPLGTWRAYFRERW